MPTTQKIDRVAELTSDIEASTALLLTEYRGLSVSEITELRRSLREVETSLAVVKNTLMKLAVAGADREELQELLTGPSAVAFVNGDPVAAAKAISSASKRYPALVVKGGWMDGRMLSAADARSLAELDSREVMLSRVAGMLKSELSRAASMMQAAQARFLRLLDAYKAKLPAAADVAAPGEAAQTGSAPDGSEARGTEAGGAAGEAESEGEG